MTPLVNLCPYSAVSWLVFLWGYWPEFKVIAHARAIVGPQDAGSMRVITMGSFVSTSAASALAYGFPAAALSARHEMFWVVVGRKSPVT